MSPILLKTLNHYLGTHYDAAEATHYLAGLPVLPLPDRINLDDWRVHVPMHLLEAWTTLSDDDRMTIHVMAQSATHPYEVFADPEEPSMN